MVVKSYLLLSQPQSVATLSYLLFVKGNMAIQSNLNFKRRLVHSGVGSCENRCGALLLCPFPSTILSYFLLICSFKLCQKLCSSCVASQCFYWVFLGLLLYNEIPLFGFLHTHTKAVNVHKLDSKLQLNSVLRVHAQGHHISLWWIWINKHWLRLVFW